jgi:outer membrane protein W
MATARVIALLGSILLLLPGAAMAGDDGFGRSGWYVGVGGAYSVNFFEDVLEDELAEFGINVDVHDTGGVNARAGYRLASWFALEAMYEWMDNFKVDVDSIDPGGTVLPIGATLFDYTTHTVTLNLKFLIPVWRTHPYLLLGVGGQHYDLDAGSAVTAATGLDFSDSGWSFAGRPGIGLDVYVTKHFLVNVEVAGVLSTGNFSTIPSVGDFFYLTAGGGIQYRF